jgi:hypothetical protein
MILTKKLKFAIGEKNQYFLLNIIPNRNKIFVKKIYLKIVNGIYLIRNEIKYGYTNK